MRIGVDCRGEMRVFVVLKRSEAGLHGSTRATSLTRASARARDAGHGWPMDEPFVMHLAGRADDQPPRPLDACDFEADLSVEPSTATRRLRPRLAARDHANRARRTSSLAFRKKLAIALETGRHAARAFSAADRGWGQRYPHLWESDTYVNQRPGVGRPSPAGCSAINVRQPFP